MTRTASVPRTRVALVNMPQMLCDIITAAVAPQPDMGLVGEVPERGSLVEVADRTQADVVVVGLPDGDLPQDSSQLFAAFPEIRVLGIEEEGRRAYLWELRPQCTALGELSPQTLVEEIRAAARPARH